MRCFLPRIGPCKPASRIRRATWQRGAWMPSRRSCHHTLRAPDLHEQPAITPSVLRGIALAGFQRVTIGGRGDAENPACRLDPKLRSVSINDHGHLLGCGSNSRAKKAEADFRISFARRSALFSRSSSLIRAA